MPLEFNKNPMIKIDTDDEKLDAGGKTLVQKWFTEVPLPTAAAAETQATRATETKAVK